MKIIIEKLENAWLISEEYDAEDSPDRKYAYSFAEDENEELGAQVSTVSHIASLIRPYDKWSKNNLAVVFKEGHKVNDKFEDD